MILNLLEEVCHKLEKINIPYMLSGSLAMSVYTVPRMTRDIDIVIQLGIGDIDEFAELFNEGFYLHKEGIEQEIRSEGMFNVIDYKSGEKIDFIIRKNTEFHIHEFERRTRAKAFGFETWVVSIEDLIISKLKWIQDLESEVQKRDIANLLNKSNVDRQYVTAWCEKLDLNTFNLI